MSAPFIVVSLALIAFGALRLLVVPDTGADAAAILALLWNREAGMPLSEIVRSEGIESARVVAALARLGELELVRHDKDTDTWAAVVSAQSNGG